MPEVTAPPIGPDKSGYSAQHRIRIEVSTSVKGIHTYSCTVELSAPKPDLDLMEATLLESDRLVAALDARYPKEVA